MEIPLTFFFFETVPNRSCDFYLTTGCNILMLLLNVSWYKPVKKHKISPPPHLDNCILLLRLFASRVPYFWRHSIQLPTIVSLSTFLPVCSYWLKLPTGFCNLARFTPQIKRNTNMKSINNIYGLKKEHELRYKDYLN